MKTFISYPSISQFRNVCHEVKRLAQFDGLDDSGNPIIDRAASMPTCTFTGTVKAHGTNSSVCFQGEDHWCQSRNNIITPEKDNAGFAFFAESHIEEFKEIVKQVPHEEGEIVCIFGEWAGASIQKGVAISGLDKMFIMIDICRASNNEEKVFLTKETFDKIDTMLWINDVF